MTMDSIITSAQLDEMVSSAGIDLSSLGKKPIKKSTKKPEQKSDKKDKKADKPTAKKQNDSRKTKQTKPPRAASDPTSIVIRTQKNGTDRKAEHKKSAKIDKKSTLDRKQKDLKQKVARINPEDFKITVANDVKKKAPPTPPAKEEKTKIKKQKKTKPEKTEKQGKMSDSAVKEMVQQYIAQVLPQQFQQYPQQMMYNTQPQFIQPQYVQQPAPMVGLFSHVPVQQQSLPQQPRRRKK
jgi:hypothetical protein